jgi:hypothetical protein
MSIIHVRHIRSTLEKLFQGHIDMSDYANRSDAEKETAFLSRSLAAYVISQQARTTMVQAAASVVDGFDDNGLDAIYFDRADNVLYIAQSKWFSDGEGSPSQGDVKKFTDGFRDLMNARFDRFNSKVRVREADILAALDNPSTRFSLFLAYSGQHTIGEHPARDIDDLLEEMNDPTEMLTLTVYGQKELHRLVSGQAEGEPISLEIGLRDWGNTSEPFKAYYGQVEASHIAEWWHANGKKLFARNLRTFIGSTDVNDSMLDTIVTCPENFWYFNNGITLLCNKIGKKPMGASDRAFGTFVCEGVSIVNGAQTVGTLGMAARQNADKIGKAKVFVRLISLV